jgi:hypothetical protein
MPVERRPEHEWLQQMLGEWEWEMDAEMEPGRPRERYAGTESVRSLGGVRVIMEGRSTTPDGSLSTSLMTLGYDPERARFAGTFVGSGMTHLWRYEGERDAATGALVLPTEGPSFTDATRTAPYRDVVELRGGDRRVMSSSHQADDGAWRQFMTTQYRRRP